MRTTKSRSSTKSSTPPAYALLIDTLVSGQNTPVLTIDELEHRNFVWSRWNRGGDRTLHRRPKPRKNLLRQRWRRGVRGRGGVRRNTIQMLESPHGIRDTARPDPDP